MIFHFTHYRAQTLLPLFLVALSIPPSLCAASPSQFGSYSQQIAKTIEQQKKSHLFPRILVIDFPMLPTGVDSSGPYLADDLSESLESQLPKGRIIPRAKLKDFLNSHGLIPLDLQSISVAYWAAEQLDANEILYGEMSATGPEIALHLRLLGVSDTKEVAKWDLKLDATPDLKLLLGKPLELSPDSFSSSLALRCSTAEFRDDSKKFKEFGGTLPKAIRWPNPPYSDQARREKLSARRVYNLYLNDKGELVLIVPQHPLQPEFDGIAIETIKRWTTEPATLAGKPVAVCVPVEITWRLY